MHLRRNKFLLIILFASGIFTSCQKEIDSTGNTPIPTPIPTPTPVASADDKLKDTVLLYTREIYLWYNQIPPTFNPRTYADPDAIMKAIRPFSIESGIQADRFSFAMRQVDYNNLSSGISGDFGIGAGFYTTTDLRVTSVERASPAGLAGIRRAWQIIKINGSSNISTSEADLAFLNKAIFGSTQTTFTFLKPDGNTVDITLTATSYQTHPVALDSVYSISSKKIGYMVFKSFLGDITEINNEFNRVFSRFATAGINDVIIDLRYNGGGYVSLAEKLTNYLAPSSATGVMMKQTFNDKNTQRNSSTNFNKVGSVNLPRVFFIVGGGTASASELVINNLKPVMDVKLIGKTTYGKPVGFFPIPVGDWYIFPVSFKTINRSGESNYYNGFSPDADVFDGVTKDFGDITELRLASAIKYITTGAFRVAAGDVYQESPKVKKGNLIFDAYTFKGAISTIR